MSMAPLVRSLARLWATSLCTFLDSALVLSTVCVRDHSGWVFGTKTAPGRKKNFSSVDGCLAGSMGLGGQGVTTGGSYLVVYAITKPQNFQSFL